MDSGKFEALLHAAFLGFHVVVFWLFLRLFVWKHYAEERFWRREPRLSLSELLAQAAGGPESLPFVSLFVPAREESQVIARTIDHLVRLEYPADRYEVVIVTDEKEALAAAAQRERAVAELEAFLEQGGAWPRGLGEAALLAVLTRLTLAEARRVHGRAGPLLADLLALPPDRQEEALFTAAQFLWRHQGRLRPRAFLRHMAARLGATAAGRAPVPHLAAALLGLGLTVVAAAARLRSGERDEAHVFRLLAEARGYLTRRAAQLLAEAWSARVLRRLERLRAQDLLSAALAHAWTLAHPTTQEVVERKREEMAAHPRLPRIKHVSVPWDFDGRLEGVCVGREVPSTKGRALNFGVSHADPRADVFGFYDAEARPDRQVLLHVAIRWLTRSGRPLLLQGPVFQVRNFHRLGPINKIVALYQSVAHNWYLPVLMRSLPFVGGTNFFVERSLFFRAAGFDPTCLSEDLDIGVRLLLETGVWPDYLPVAASEQTPPTLLSYFRQRLRWGYGWLQVFSRLVRTRLSDPEREAIRRRLLRELFVKGHLHWTFYQLATILVPVSWLLAGRELVTDPKTPEWVGLVLHLGIVPYLAFTIHCLFRYRPFMDAEPSRSGWLAAVAYVVPLLLLPVSAFFLPLPFSAALVLWALGIAPRGWVKTPRTAE